MPGLPFLAACALLCCALPVRVKGDASVNKSVKVWASVGDTVILPCQIQLTADNNVPSVEWSKNGTKVGPKRSISLLYRDGCETFEEKDPVFRYRTSLFMEELKHGNVSLRLSDVRLSDDGRYRCRILRAPRDAGTIDLSVGAVLSEPKLSLVQGVAVTAQCEAACWSSLPVVTFHDAQGNDVHAEEQKNDSDSTSGCVSVTRRATLTSGDWLTCKVHQSETNQTRLTKIYIPEECLTSCIPMIVVTVVVTIIIPGAIFAFLYWKLCKSEGEHKSLSTQSSHRNSTSSNGEGQSLRSQADPVQNGTAELRGEVDELKSSLCVKDETIRRLREELRSKQSPVECRHGQPIHRTPSESSQDASNPTNLAPEPSPRDVDPKPTGGNRPKSGNFTQNKDSKISIPIPSPSRQVQKGRQRNSVPDLLKGNCFSPPANLSKEESEALLK